VNDNGYRTETQAVQRLADLLHCHFMLSGRLGTEGRVSVHGFFLPEGLIMSIFLIDNQNKKMAASRKTMFLKAAQRGCC
jgi:hypothetical protein